MNDTVNLTLALAGYFYFGSLLQWREYARVLTAGKITAYKRSAAYRNQSLQNFFELFRGTWKKETPLPSPEEYGLISLQPENVTQSDLIDELLAA